MASDIFTSRDAYLLLRGRKILLFGDSNMRALYKDLLWLIEEGTLIPQRSLQLKNEFSHANDERLSNGTLHNGRHYTEIRQYSENMFVRFEFLTRLHNTEFIKTIESVKQKRKMSIKHPDVIIINSCLWDLTRWGPNGVADFIENVQKTMALLQKNLDSTRVIWTTTLPPSTSCRGGFLVKEVEFLRSALPWHVLEANYHVANCAYRHNFDVLDFHYHMRFDLEDRAHDGIHWCPKSVRYMTNMLLTHLARCWDKNLPANTTVSQNFILRSETPISVNPCERKKEERKEN